MKCLEGTLHVPILKAQTTKIQNIEKYIAIKNGNK